MESDMPKTEHENVSVDGRDAAPISRYLLSVGPGRRRGAAA